MKTTERTCQWYVSDEQPECGKPADGGTVAIKGRVSRATVPVCKQHKAEHNENFARLRTTGRTTPQ